MKASGRVPSRAPPHYVVGAGPEIPARFLIVQHIWIPFHDELYLEAIRKHGLAKKWMC
jgi:hypothetical protein